MDAGSSKLSSGIRVAVTTMVDSSGPGSLKAVPHSIPEPSSTPAIKTAIRPRIIMNTSGDLYRRQKRPPRYDGEA